MKISKLWLLGLMLGFAQGAGAELTQMDEDGLAAVSGQGGIYLSGDVSINESGGPLRGGGARVAFQVKENGGWFVLDNIRGKISFEGLTLRVRNINSGFGGDGASFNKDVLEIGLPNSIKYDNVRYTYATSSMPDAGSAQTDIFTVEMHGQVEMQGNLLVFPTGTP